MKNKPKPVLAWGVVDTNNNQLCTGWLYSTRKLCIDELDYMYPQYKPIRVKLSVYKKRKAA